MSNYISITKEILISTPKKARVLQDFDVEVQSIEDGFIATSDISDVYELGETVPQAVNNYLSSLVDELIWFHNNEQRLSLVLLKDLGRLKNYITLA